MSELGNSGVYKLRDKNENEGSKENNLSFEQEEKQPSCLENLKYYIWEYCGRTTVHGFNYLGEKGRAIPERIWWAVTILVALYFCITLIIQTYQKWINSPVIVTFATTQTPIWKIPFPAVTICSEIKARKSRFNYTDIYIKKRRGEMITEKESEEFEYISLVCNSPSNLLNANLTTVDNRAIDFLMEVSPNFKKMMFKVYWRGQEYKDITDLFSPIITTEGLCYTFNIMDRSEIFTDIVTNYRDSFSTFGKRSKWSMASGYTEDADLDAYPRRSYVSGISGGLKIMFRVPREDIDYACIDSMQGFKVVLHHPSEVPRGKNKYFRVALDQSVTAAIKPNMMTTADELINYKPKDRRCYFSRERKLKYFKIYNQINCLNECLIDFTLETCGCVGFHMQKENTTRICSASKLKCVTAARAKYLETEIKIKIEQSTIKSNKRNPEEKCDCLPACNSLKFDVETSQAFWDWKAFLEIEKQAGDWHPEDDDIPLNQTHFARLNLYYKEMQFITSERNELYGQTDFWASCGGLLGLFTGFSFMSALEIVYYLTLRLACNLSKFGRHYWSGSEELLKKSGKVKDEKFS